MSDATPIAPFIRRFLLEHLIRERNLSLNTQAGYRDTLLLLLPFVARSAHLTVDRLSIEDFTAPVVRAFLQHLERQRGVSGATRNQRLVAIHSLARFIGETSPAHLSWCREIRSIPFKRTATRSMTYLEKDEMDAVLATPDRRVPQGARDHALLLFLFNSGARAAEAAELHVGDLTWGRSPAVDLLGKGNKHRCCPLWPETMAALKPLTSGRAAHERVFLNHRAQPLTRSGIYKLVQRTAAQAARSQPSIKAKHVGPHSVRHSCAVHLLRNGVDINTIRGWLGHVSLDTTHVYAEVDLEMKAKALAKCDVPGNARIKRWHRDPGVITFLKTLRV
jgi:site-specific recombinase XerD